MSETGEAVGISRRSELAAFLRARRAELQPADVGLPTGPGQRRTPGLRREEVAQLSGVGITWYTWLEQARDIPATAQVIDALARALRVNPEQHRHLRTLAELPSPPPEPRPDGALPRMQRLLDAAVPNPAAVFDARYDYLAWNEPYVRVRHDPAAVPPEHRNLLWFMFVDREFRTRLRRWESAARAVLGQFRTAAGNHPADPRFARLRDILSGSSPEFRRWWAEFPVEATPEAVITIDHPQTGPISLELFHLRPMEHPGLRLVTQIPVGPADRAGIESLLDRPPS